MADGSKISFRYPMTENIENEIEIRLATINDLSAMERAGKKVFDNEIKVNRTREFLSDPRHHLMLAFDRDRVVGMASAFHYIHPDKDPTLFINEVGVTEEYQNQGIGRKLVKYLFEYGKTLDCKEAWIATEQSNKAARKAYLAAGGAEDNEPVVLIEFK